MNLDVQFKIKSDANCSRYLRENSYWYKILNRYPERFNDLVNEMKTTYRLRTSDKISDFTDKLDFISSIFNTLR